MTDLPLASSKDRSLAGLMKLDLDASNPWSADELAAILRHQLVAPLVYDLRTIAPGGEQTVTAMALSVRGTPPPKSFGDLISHPHPPVELLNLMKQFARSARESNSLPGEVATVLYYAAIAAALHKLGVRITELDEGSLRKGFAWCLGQGWVDPAVMQLFRDVQDSRSTIKRDMY